MLRPQTQLKLLAPAKVAHQLKLLAPAKVAHWKCLLNGLYPQFEG